MRCVRYLLIVLLALDLPGFGGAFAAASHCAMQPAAEAFDASFMHPAHDHAAMAAATGEHVAHCCADNGRTDSAPADAATDHACSDGMQCQCSTSMYQASQPLDASVRPVLPQVVPILPLHISPQIVVPILRPPIALSLG